MHAGDDRIGLHHEIVARIGRQERIVALEPTGTREALGKRCEIAGDELELTDTPGAPHRPYLVSSDARAWRELQTNPDAVRREGGFIQRVMGWK